MLQTVYWILAIILTTVLLLNSITLFANMRKEYKRNKLVNKALNILRNAIKY